MLEQLYNEILNENNFDILINKDENIDKYSIRTWIEKILVSGKPIRESFINHSNIICYIKKYR